MVETGTRIRHRCCWAPRDSEAMAAKSVNVGLVRGAWPHQLDARRLEHLVDGLDHLDFGERLA